MKAVREACGQHTNYAVVLVNSVLNELSNGMSEIVLAFTSLALTPGGKVMEHLVYTLHERAGCLYSTGCVYNFK